MNNKPLARELTTDIIQALQRHYFAEDPPPKFVTVDAKTVRADKADSAFFCAKVTIEVEHIAGSPKKHTVHIRFRLDQKKRVIPASISYL